MRLYHFVKAQHALEDIVSSRLKIATLPDLNDPFELLAFSLHEPHAASALLSVKEDLSSRTGLLCFSRDYSNPVQWSHYAERHRGMCLGFDIPDEFVIPVQYVKERLDPVPLLLNAQEAELALAKSISTKFEHWSYEQEWRIWTTLDERDVQSGLYFQSFGELLRLREVIFGHACRTTYEEISSALGRQRDEVAIFKARLSPTHFRVDTEPMK